MRRRRANWVLLGALWSCEVASTDQVGGFGPPPTSGPDANLTPPPDLGTSDVSSPDAGTPPRDIALQLEALEGIFVREIDPPASGGRAFLLEIEQPVDHDQPRGVRFRQRMVLRHLSASNPMVIYWTGYGLFGRPESFASLIAEPAGLLQANQLTVEHRFFGESGQGPDTDWSKLTIRQAAYDAHRIVTILRTIYDRAWVGTGVSKGGMTSIFHHRFFPEDLNAIVPYVAPISFSAPDRRYLEWVANIGPSDGLCRARVLDLSVEGIERREELGLHHRERFPGADAVPVTYLPVWAAYRSFRYHWVFWQRRGRSTDCANLPPRDAPIEDIASYLSFQNPNDRLRYDPDIDPYYYQSRTELGFPAIDYSHSATAWSEVMVGDALSGAEPNPWDDRLLRFDPSPMAEVDRFLRVEAEHVLAVYGAWDPWTGGRVQGLDPTRNRVVVAPEAGHSASLADLPDAELEGAVAELYGWVGRTSFAAPNLESVRARVEALRAHHEVYVDLARKADSALFRLR